MAESITKDITEDGALVEVDISGVVDGGKIERTLALLDTGTNVSQISKKLFDQLGLPELGMSTCESVSAEAPVPTVVAKIRIVIKEGLSYTSEPPMVGVHPAMDAQRFQVMLGRDVLGGLRFSYDGHNGHFELSK